MFQAISKPVISQAFRIANEDNDVAQSIVVMAYQAYESAQKKGKELSVGELVNFMKHRANDLKHGNRLHVGSVSKRISKDVYSPRNYLSGDVEIHSFDYREDDEERDYSESIYTACKDWSSDVIFQIGLEGFFKKIGQESKLIFTLRSAGYKYPEISKQLGQPTHKIRNVIKEAGHAFIRYFDLPKTYIEKYGLN